jgi:16S rRNA processing protein RimM
MSDEPKGAAAERMTVAVIRRPRGVRGEVVTTPLSDFIERFEPGAEIRLTAPNDVGRSARIESSWLQKGDVILKFDNVNSVAEAEALVGWRVQVPVTERFELEDGEFFIDDLVGCRVESDGVVVGEVVRVESFGGGATLVVRLTNATGSDAARERLIPFVHDICPDVDTAAKRIRITPPEGLLDI